MSQRPTFPSQPDAPLRPRLVAGWSVFFGLVIVGLGLFLFRGRAVPVLLDLTSR